METISLEASVISVDRHLLSKFLSQKYLHNTIGTEYMVRNIWSYNSETRCNRLEV